MTLWEFWLLFSLGLVSSAHCAQMCGPIVLSYSLALSGNGRSLAKKKKRTLPIRSQLLLAHLAYNAGRIATYSALGAAAGLAGGTMGWLGKMAGIQNGAALVAGALMVLAGLFMLGWLPGRALEKTGALRIGSRFLKPLGRRISSPAVAGKFSLGVMLGFLPCGLIYAALLKAVESSAPLRGALTMLAFGLGTTGALVTMGLFSSFFARKVGRWGVPLAAFSVTLLGVFLLWRGAMPMVFGSLASGHGGH